MSRSTFTFFLLILSFGVLFVGCSSSSTSPADEFSFSDTDLAKVHALGEDLVGSASSMAGSDASASSQSAGPTEDLTLGNPLAMSSSSSSAAAPVPTILTDTTATSSSAVSVAPVADTTPPPTIPVDAAKKALYISLRMAAVDQGSNVYRVNNPFLNVRAGMDVTSTLVERVNNGVILTVLDIPNAGWAKVKLQDGKEGFVSLRYIAKLTTEEKLPEAKKEFEGKYYVNFKFLNIRKEPSTQAEKIAELPGQAIVKPLSMNKEWAKVSFDGKEGYVSAQYLEPFQPVFLVRQDSYKLPVLQYSADDTASLQALPKAIAALKGAGKKIVTLRSLFDTVLAQESKDARIAPGAVALTVVGVNSKNLKQVTDALQGASVTATLFLQTKDIGLTGITEKTVLRLLANGYDLQSGGHTGDDLRSMTDSQVSLELGQSKKLIEDITKKEVYAVAYPKGGVNDRIMSAAANLAYLFGISDAPDKQFTRVQFLRLPSLHVTSGMTGEDVLKLVQ